MGSSPAQITLDNFTCCITGGHTQGHIAPRAFQHCIFQPCSLIGHIVGKVRLPALQPLLQNLLSSLGLFLGGEAEHGHLLGGSTAAEVYLLLLGTLYSIEGRHHALIQLCQFIFKFHLLQQLIGQLIHIHCLRLSSTGTYR